MSKKIIVLHFLKTIKVSNDSRVLRLLKLLDRKEGNETVETIIISLENNNSKKLELLEEYKNQSLRLITRVFKKGKGYIFKIPEYTVYQIKYFLKYNPDVVVFHDNQNYLIQTLFSFLKRINLLKTKLVWDQHELPHDILVNNYFMKRILRFIVANQDIVLVANEERRDFLLMKGVLKKEDTVIIIFNYPLKEHMKSVVKINQDRNIVWLGNATESRGFDVFWEAFKLDLNQEYSLNIAGNVDSIYADEVDNHPKVHAEYYKHDELFQLLENANLSFIFYRNISNNNWYCEPNRLYQCINSTLPIVVGSNPKLLNMVNKYEIGVSIDYANLNPENLIKAVSKVKDNESVFRQNLNELKDEVCFDTHMKTYKSEIWKALK